MSRDYKLYLEDILAAIEKTESYVREISYEQFKLDDMRRDAVLRNLEIIGEATKKLPPEIRKQNTDIDWRKIAGLRDILIHAYFTVDDDIIWDIVQNKLPELSQGVTNILEQKR